MGNQHNLFCDFLSCLGVKHTFEYSAKKFENMPFQTMFGLAGLLKGYGISNESVQLGSKSELLSVPTPYIAHVDDVVIIVTSLDGDKVNYLTQGEERQMSVDEFEKRCDGKVLMVTGKDGACEPDYSKHYIIEIAGKAKKWVLAACALWLMAVGGKNCGAFSSLPNALLVIINLIGLYFTFLLVQKSAHIHNGHADKVCGVLQKEGCNHVLETSASKFFGLFGWSEVGFAYFSVSLGCLLLKPEMTGMLAMINGMCLPFTVWSIWYQKFRAKAWCTLCVGVQTMLWLLFFSYLAGGYWYHITFDFIDFISLGAIYVGVMLAVNALMPFIENKEDEAE